ncbi:MAG: GNAT family N-acetyltransferase [Bacteroidetes bacterium]|nr:GNAT family N-acetyltransferase [Bacteroidota bacterium]
MLRALATSDTDALEAIAYDQALWTNSTSRIERREDLEAYVRQALHERARGTAVPFVTIVKGDCRVVGSTRFAAIERLHRRAEIGWTWVARPWQRSFVNTEAKFLMLRHAFEEWRLRRIEFKTASFNEASRRALLRIGATEEGTLRQHMLLHGGRNRDSVYYSVIDEEWPHVKRRLEGLMSRP